MYAQCTLNNLTASADDYENDNLSLFVGLEDDMRQDSIIIQ